MRRRSVEWRDKNEACELIFSPRRRRRREEEEEEEEEAETGVDDVDNQIKSWFPIGTILYSFSAIFSDQQIKLVMQR